MRCRLAEAAKTYQIRLGYNLTPLAVGKAVGSLKPLWQVMDLQKGFIVMVKSGYCEGASLRAKYPAMAPTVKQGNSAGISR